VPEASPAAEAAPVFLLHLARALAAWLDLAALAEEAAGDARLADVGETSVPVAHEFNNFLNALMLHVAVLQYKPPEAIPEGLAEVRQQAMASADLVQQFQNYRRRTTEAPRPAELNRAARAAVRRLGGAPAAAETILHVPMPPGGPGSVSVAVRCRLDLADGALPAPGPPGDLKRLCVFLLRNAAGAAALNEGCVVVRTSHAHGKVVLRVEELGTAVPWADLLRLFEPTAPAREGTSGLELAACRTLARRTHGALRAEEADGGAAFVVEWGDGPP
jgi:C4-dicarboxylate-specific signal transduction histidine kinase